MPTYEFDALNPGGTTMTDVITADTPRDAREKLRRRGLHVTRIDIARELDDDRQKSVVITALASRQARSELVMVTQQFATLLKAGIPLSDGIKALVDQIEGRLLSTVFRDLNEKVQGGSSLAQAMESHADIFSTLYINMVRTGEASGTLATVLQRLADFMRKRERLGNRVKGALTYPIIILGIAMLIFLFLMTSVVPNIADLLVRQGIEMMWLTSFYIGLSDIVVNWWPVGILVTAITALAFWHWFWRTDAGIRQRDKIAMSIPIVGKLVRKSAVARFTSTFSILLEAGIPALDALLIVRDVIGNVWLADIINVVREKVTEGADIATPIKQSGLFPPTVGYMIAVGEESGQLEDMLVTISEAYEEEVETEAGRLTSMLEPLMIVGLALVVASVVYAILDPMMKLTQGRM